MQSDKAKQIAEKLVVMARELGASDVVVVVGMTTDRIEAGATDADFYVSWSGRALAIRGLAELGMERLRGLFRG